MMAVSRGISPTPHADENSLEACAKSGVKHNFLTSVPDMGGYNVFGLMLHVSVLALGGNKEDGPFKG